MQRHTTLVVLGLILSVSASAAPITVGNFSFETLPVLGLPSTCGTGCSYSVDSIPGWINGGDSGQFQPGTHASNFSYFNTLSDGNTHAYSNGSNITQTVGATVQAGVLYSLIVDIGDRNEQPPAGSAFLVINGNSYGSTGTFVSGGWGAFTSTYLGTIADAGASITIELRSAGAQANFDNVRLDSTAVPEPATGALFAFGFVIMAALVHHRKNRHARSSAA